MNAGLSRRALLTTAASAAFAGAACTPRAEPPPPVSWAGAAHQRGHRLRAGQPLPTAAVQKNAAVLIVG
ncbi:MAG: hypothetical protein Q8R98_00635, partial [Rubrivivax sp.]|nr:hypothetical protein [Rubrivivax sp.]